jgi:hypothetical protein
VVALQPVFAWSRRGKGCWQSFVVVAMLAAAAGCAGPTTLGAALDEELRVRGFEPREHALVIDEAASEIDGEFGDARIVASPECPDSPSSSDACARVLRREVAEVLQARLGSRGPTATPARFRVKGKEDFEFWFYTVIPPLLLLGIPTGRDVAEITLELEVGGEVLAATGRQDLVGGVYSDKFQRGAVANALADAIEQLDAKLRARHAKSASAAGAVGGLR